MKTTHYILLLCFLLSFMTACGEETSPKNNLPAEGATQILNGSFEDDNAETTSPKNWTIAGDKSAAGIVKGGCSGNYALYFNKSVDYKVETAQVMSGLADGTYDLIFYYRNSGGQKACFVSAKSSDGKDRITSLHTATSVWTKSIVRGIKVTGNTLSISIISDANSGNWSIIDGLSLEKTDKEYTLLKGGDVSELSYIEQMGGKFYEDGKEKDCFEILKNKGFNIVRLRLYNDPGNPGYTPSNRLPAGIQNPDDILRLSKRAKQAGMQIQLTFHYSDYWTNGATQNKPHEWANLNYNDLKKAVYDFTFDFMTKMKNQETTPEFVSLGNETVGGLLFPDGKSQNFAQTAELFNQGYAAVKAVSPESEVIIHLDEAGDKNRYDQYFGKLNENGAKYDIIGASYYPFWTKKTVTEMREWADYITAKFDKDIFIMESGYNWNPVLPNGYFGQLSNNGPYQDVYPSSPQGQKDFLLELFTGIKMAEKGRVVGCLYWDPVMIAVPGVGWELGGQNVVSNTTLFDFSGNALESLDAFKYNN
jgi:arabinogalactan endo-1,4-beta-galactosidase